MTTIRDFEQKDYEVSVTITFSTRVSFAPIERKRPLTYSDAMDNFLGVGLDEVMNSGEYHAEIGEIRIKETT